MRFFHSYFVLWLSLLLIAAIIASAYTLSFSFLWLLSVIVHEHLPCAL
nr:MAG TPA: hypothetical protein [Caudoviricetes sp.]